MKEKKITSSDMFSALFSCVAVSLIHSTGCTVFHVPPEAQMTVTEIIIYHGYPVQVFEALTIDGYILQLHRIPFGRNGTFILRNPENFFFFLKKRKRPVVFLQHGLLGSSADWVTNLPNESLGKYFSTEIIIYHGYPVQVFEALTIDGYILQLHRIPFGRNGTFIPRNPENFFFLKKRKRPVVFLQHGLLGSSADWVTNLPNESLGKYFSVCCENCCVIPEAITQLL
ncbi:unnamed protein product [Gongylonema pulchrum]|uniref:Partial AB-hydrolase lipase domain-containing protein n=1 Tax=Gongylonema pulchrum TaxID=637853 RepID=A0A3P7MGQ4_9BILA|nr:unnamed protein product [Gongylonema pulchrum]